MLIDKKLLKSLGLALSLPSTIIFMAVLCKELVNSDVLSKTWAIILFLAVILNTLFMMVYYAFRNKD
ncbi:MAG: hypothetical protein HN576_17175 [Bacteriovoracaceae bacterium]|jgi:hypothetical protein|nr:hypothetical protein [Bacteriovoracaceae bacterium]